ncbi:hypothetical protein BH11MYX1_BH11MYX1_13150 [soil metagenome]
MGRMDFIGPIILILGGILACASLIISKDPKAKDAIGKLQAYQGWIGVLLLVFGVIDFFRIGIHIFGLISVLPFFSLVVLAYIGSSILLGIMFGMPIVAKLSASGAAKGDLLGKKLAPYQTIIGIVGIVSGLLALFYALNILR